MKARCGILFLLATSEVFAEEAVTPRMKIVFAAPKCDGMSDGMPAMTHRTTFALDGVTATRLKRLASIWQVSQAEVVRRAVAQAESAAASIKPDPVVLLRDYHAKGGLDRAKAEAYLVEVDENRKHWRGQ